MKKIFRKDKYIKVMLNYIIEHEAYDFIHKVAFAASTDGWVPECDGKEVIDGYIGGFIILDVWCEVVEDEN